MKKLIIFSVLSFFYLTVSAQINIAPTNKDTIRIFYSSKGVLYYKNAELLNVNSIETLLSANNNALSEFSAYKNFNRTGTLFTVGGAGLMLYGLYSYMRSENALPAGSYNPAPLLLGFGAVVVSLPVAMVSKKHLKNSVEIYNNSIKRPEHKSISLNLGINSNGLGLHMTF